MVLLEPPENQSWCSHLWSLWSVAIVTCSYTVVPFAYDEIWHFIYFYILCAENADASHANRCSMLFLPSAFCSSRVSLDSRYGTRTACRLFRTQTDVAVCFSAVQNFQICTAKVHQTIIARHSQTEFLPPSLDLSISLPAFRCNFPRCSLASSSNDHQSE